uniref:Sterile alpha motif domain-containing protein 5 n=1 Tax=Trichogramma kaykai TaxID=54128 RepID=A0ABD2W513_9HYME
MSKACNIVVEWLHSLHLGEYAESFVDNGYDDLEICKQIRDPDLDAIGVLKQSHRLRLLQSVKRLREEGAASVYFTLEETTACLEKQSNSDKDSTTSALVTPTESNTPDIHFAPNRSTRQSGKFLDEYEEGKAELVRIPKMQLRLILQEKLRSDGIHLTSQPYTTPDGQRGYLEGLASRYADNLKTHYKDVLEPLEELRRHEINLSLRMSYMKFPSSYSQTLYVPGKYSPSSCLSDREEDEIYGFGYGVYGRQLLQQRQQKLALATQNYQNNDLLKPQLPSQHSCLSPRSAFFYEFPPNEQGHNSSKKKMTFSRILRGLKTNKKDKHGHIHSSPRLNASKLGVPQRVSTCFTLIKKNPLIIQKITFQILRDIRRGLMQLGRDSHDPYDDTYMYDEELKVKEFQKLETGGQGDIQHWYDEPPYESDPEDFLMSYNSEDLNKSCAASNRYSQTKKKYLFCQLTLYFSLFRGCNTLGTYLKKQDEGIISLRTAGDISLPKERDRITCSSRRGLILPQGNNIMPTVIPLKHSRTCRESGEYTSDLQSRSSDEENRDSPRSQSTDYEDPEVSQFQSKVWQARQQSDLVAMTPGQMTNYGAKNLKGFNTDCCKSVPVTSTIAGRARTLRKDVQRKISRLKQQRGSFGDSAFPCSASSIESLPSGSGSSSTQALVRAGSNHSSVSYEDREPISPHQGEIQCANASTTSLSRCKPPQVLCRARALVDCLPNPYDKDALAFKKGEVIEVVQMNASGSWRGIAHNRLGHFKFINVEILNERPQVVAKKRWSNKYKQKPGSVPELLQRMQLQDYISVFLLNGYEDLELFRELEPADLDYLRIQHPEHRAKILTAVQLINDLQYSEGEEVWGSNPEIEDTVGLEFGVSRLNIGFEKFQAENNLNVKTLDNQPSEFQINVPLGQPIPANETNYTATLNQ